MASEESRCSGALAEKLRRGAGVKERVFEPYNLEGDGPSGPMKALGWWDAETELCELHKHKAVIFESYKKSRALGEHYQRLALELSPLWRRQRDTSKRRSTTTRSPWG